MKIKQKGLLQFVLTLAATIIIFVFLFHKIPWIKVLNCIKMSDFKIVLLTLLISSIINILVTAKRWKLILGRLGYSIKWREAILVKMGSDPIITILPFRSGEFSRIAYLKELRDVPYSKSALSIAIEYILNICLLLFFIILGLIIRWGGNNNFSQWKINVLALGFLSISAWVSNKFSLKLKYTDLKNVISSPGILTLTFVIGLGELAIVYLLANAIGITLPLYALLIFMPIIILGSSLPISINGLGVREALLLFFFSRFASSDAIFSLGILYSFAEHIFPATLGLAIMGIFLKRVISRR